MMDFYSIAAPIALYLVCAVVAFLLIRGIYREIKEALKKDEKQGGGKYFKAKLAEYGIVLAVGVVALVVVLTLKGGPLKSISESIYGKPAPTIDSPFFGDFDK